MLNPLSVIRKSSGGADDKASEKLNSILNSSDNLTVNGSKYYISQNGDDSADGKTPETAWQTLEKLKMSRDMLKSGDAVLFERGSVFRQEYTVYDELYKNNSVLVAPFVSYGAYGIGPKPKFYGSSFNFALRKWERHSENIWKTELCLQDAGIIVFDNESCIGVKKGSVDELEYGNDFYHDTDNGILYLLCENGSPDEVYKDIEIGCDRPVFLFCGKVGNVKLDNLDIRYVGAHAISGYEFNHDIEITNCVLSYIGGSWQRRDIVRYGNAVQFWDSCNDIKIENCYVNNVYDAGLTFQGGKGAEYKNISFSNNLITYCNYCIEFFIQGTQNAEGKYKTQGVLQNIDFCNNIMQFAGYGVCEQRPDKFDSSNICGWATDVGKNVENFNIKGNIFDLSARQFVYWIWDEEGNANISGNSFYLKVPFAESAVKYGKSGSVPAADQNELECAVKKFDKNPKSVKWLTD